jgi:hypothetical protein
VYSFAAFVSRYIQPSRRKNVISRFDQGPGKFRTVPAQQMHGGVIRADRITTPFVTYRAPIRDPDQKVKAGKIAQIRKPNMLTRGSQQRKSSPRARWRRSSGSAVRRSVHDNRNREPLSMKGDRRSSCLKVQRPQEHGINLRPMSRRRQCLP